MCKDRAGIAPLKFNGMTISSSEDKAEVLNNQFYSVFTDEDISHIPEVLYSFPDMPGISFNTEGIYKLLNELNINKSPGPDKIPTRVLKCCATEIAPLLQIIFTQSMASGILPNDWLSANITPIYKKGDRANPSHYRPISLTAICCKIMEHIVYHSIMEHLQNYNILYNYQYGFRQGHSSETQLIAVIEDILYAMDHHQQLDLVLLDFCKAFDTVPHCRLLSKLSSYGIQNQTYRWTTSWLTNRKQRVTVDGVASKWVPVKSGVPQGTVLGPLMFLIYINDIGENVFSTLKLFADDCILYRTISTPSDCHKLQEDLNNVYQWSKLWQMNFNINKCVVLKCYKSASPITAHYHLNNHILECVKEHSYLGVILDQTMSFSPHVNNIVSKASKILNFVKQNLYKCSPLIKATAYISLVRPILEYASSAWDPHLLKDIYSIDQIQCRAARWVLQNYNRYSSVTSMQQQLNWSTLQQRQQRSRLVLFIKLCKIPSPLRFHTIIQLHMVLQDIIITCHLFIQVQEPMFTCTAIFQEL